PLVLIAVGAIFYVTYGKYKVEVQQEVQRELIHMAHDGQNLVQGDWLDGINSPADYQNADYLKIEKNLTFQDHYGKFYTTVYKYATNHLYSIIDDNYPMFASAPTFKFEPGMTCQTRNVNDTWSEVTDYNLVVQQKGFLACQSSDDDGNWLFGLGPIFNTDKTQVVGVYEVGINTSAFTARVDKIMRQDLWMMGTLLLLLVVILVVGTRSMLRSIWKLQEGAGQLANEQWDVVVDIKSRDEVAVLANTFNFMAQNIRQYIAATTDLSNSYKRFVPQQQLDMLGKPSILDVHLGDQVEREMSVLVSTIRSFHEISKDMTPEENFAFMNKFLQYIAPAVRDHNGLINKYLGNGVLALFPDQPLSALQASVEMRQSLATYNAERVKRGKKPISIGIAIHKGPLVLGIIGEGQRLDGNVLSEDVNFVTELEALSEKVGATLLIPAELMRSIDQSGQFAYRTLGLLKFAGQEEAVELCDVFEADLDAQKKLKAKTKEMFERAIVMYQQGRFYDARELFIQVIKQNQDDKIAKLYFYQCDEFFQRGTSRDWQGTLDVT
ncbi:MAG: adenylate/guanylate cyclase domain-containing protein, partial [Tumebacillaceae bacterium]